MPRLLCAVLYTQGQVRSLLGIPVETFRAWRDVLPALSRHKGHGPTFTPGDVVALAVLVELVRCYGIRVGTIAIRLDELFGVCHMKSWLTLDTCLVILTENSVRVVPIADRRSSIPERSALVVACGPLVARLRTALVASEPEERQGHLQFPLAAVKATGTR